MLPSERSMAPDSPHTSTPPHPSDRQYGPKPDREGWLEWEVVPTLRVKTYYRIHGPLHDGKGEDGLDPIVMAHGGPGCPHELLLPLLSLRKTGRTMIFYE